MGFKMKGFPYPGKSPMKSKDLKKVVKELRGAVKAHGRQADIVEKHMSSSPMKIKKGKIIYKDGKKYYQASDGTLHTGQVSDYEAELAEDRKGVGSGGNRKVMKDGSKNKSIMQGGKEVDFKNRNAKKSDAQKRVEEKRKAYNKMTPAEKKKLQDAADARRKAFEKSRKKKGK
jgi:hypothetical protein|tara:strand:+ start:28 stop:546 length:519 start_codon:yes stop_codon:yes gene_type:complete